MTATRRQAREWAIQLLSAADLNPPDDVIVFKIAFWQQIRSLGTEDGGSGGEEVRGKLREFAEARFLGVLKNQKAIDKAILPFITEDWTLDRLGTVERAVLRMGAWELLNTDIPTPIVINEAVDIVNWYATPKARGLINAVLDGFAKSLEPERSQRIAEKTAEEHAERRAAAEKAAMIAAEEEARKAEIRAIKKTAKEAMKKAQEEIEAKKAEIAASRAELLADSEARAARITSAIAAAMGKTPEGETTEAKE